MASNPNRRGTTTAEETLDYGRRRSRGDALSKDDTYATTYSSRRQSRVEPHQLSKDASEKPAISRSVIAFWVIAAIMLLASLAAFILMFFLYMQAKANKAPYDDAFETLKKHLVHALDRPDLYYKDAQAIADAVESLPSVIEFEKENVALKKKKYRDLLTEPLQKSSDYWKSLGNNLYYFSRGGKTWQDAEDFCISHDAHLASVHSDEEQRFIRSHLENNSWIGLTVKQEEGKWGWSDGSRVLTQYWSNDKAKKTQVMGKSSQNCALMVPSVTYRNWNTENCNELYNWVCKENRDHEEQ